MRWIPMFLMFLALGTFVGCEARVEPTGPVIVDDRPDVIVEDKSPDIVVEDKNPDVIIEDDDGPDLDVDVDVNKR